MDWKDLGGALIKAGAPIVGTALGGPLGGMVGNAVGSILANALGVEPTPEAVNNAVVNGDPAVVGPALTAAQSEVIAKWETIRAISHDMAEVDQANIAQVNETIRAETAAGVSWWHWRHLIGYMALVWFAAPIPAFARLTFQYDAGAAAQLTALIGACVPLYGFIAGLLGYVAQDTTRLKGIAMTGQPAPGVASTIVKAVVAGRKK